MGTQKFQILTINPNTFFYGIWLDYFKLWSGDNHLEKLGRFLRSIFRLRPKFGRPDRDYQIGKGLTIAWSLLECHSRQDKELPLYRKPCRIPILDFYPPPPTSNLIILWFLTIFLTKIVVFWQLWWIFDKYIYPFLTQISNWIFEKNLCFWEKFQFIFLPR